MQQLKETIEKLKPKLLILDPFVRLHSVDENASGEVAKLLQHLRYLQRTYQLAVALVHHAKKGASFKRPGQALRGSSEFHAWVDSGLYLTRFAGSSDIRLTVEHRAEQSCDPLPLRLVSDGDDAHLQIARTAAPPQEPTLSSPEQQLLQLFAASPQPMRMRTLRQRAGLRHETVSHAVAALADRGVIEITDLGYRLVNPAAS